MTRDLELDLDGFAPYLDDPRAFVRARPRLDLESVGRRASGEPVTVTARSLFLTRDVTVQVSEEPTYRRDERAFRLPDWNADTYLGGFLLGAHDLSRWVGEGTRVLDLASGLSLFATEAMALGLPVDCADAELGSDDQPMFQAAARAVAQDYAGQLRFLARLADDGRHERYRMDDANRALLGRLVEAAEDTAAAYPRGAGRRFRDDATRLVTVAEGAYDVVLSGWLLVHLGEADERRVVESAVRVTRRGGEVRLRAGTGDDLAARLEGWWPEGRISGKRVSITAKADDAVVLRVGG